MARQIVILEKLPGPVTFRYLLWAAVPAGREKFYADAAKVSSFLDTTAPELSALRAGTVVERVETGSWPGLTLAQVQAQLVTRWTAFQAEVTADTTWQRYGSAFDGTTWQAGGF